MAVCRELDDALLLLRTCRPEVRLLVLRTEGDPLAVASADVAMTSGYEHDWFVREVVLFWKRTLKRVDRAWQSVIAVIEPGSCFVGTLLELALAADQTSMVDGAELLLTGMNFGPLPRASGLTRLESRFLTRSDHVTALAQRVGDSITAAEAVGLGLITEERAGLANAGRAGEPETLETKIFSRRPFPEESLHQG
jgi:benzoyl-CoA-dihydrodiol lyase